jgi:hypothetical protein
LTMSASSALPSAERAVHVNVPAVAPVFALHVVVVRPLADLCSSTASWEDNSRAVPERSAGFVAVTFGST